MFRSLTKRLVLSYVILTVCLNLLLVVTFNHVVTISGEQHVDHLLGSLIEKPIVDGRVSLKEIEDITEDEESEHRPGNLYLKASDADGNALVKHGFQPTAADVVQINRIAEQMDRSSEKTTRITLDGGRMLRVMTKKLPDGSYVQVGLLMADNSKLRSTVFKYSLGWGTSLGGLVSLIGWWMIHREMKGVKNVTTTARKILNGSLDARVPERQHVIEVSELANAFNQMLDKIDQSVADLKDVSSNVAHDLRGPVTRIRGNVEVVLRGEPSLEDYREMAEKVIDDANRLDNLISTIIEIALLDSGAGHITFAEVDLAHVLEESIELYADVAELNDQTLTHHASPVPPIKGNVEMLQRMLANLLDNALKFTPQQGKVEVSLSQEAGKVVLQVSDTGPGIPEKDRGHVFDRFYRGEESRSTLGNGLGLSYVKSVADAHGCEVNLLCPDTGGTLVKVSFPEVRFSHEGNITN